MQVVDLPGFREFSDNSEKQQLADKIETLVSKFMEDKRSIMLCPFASKNSLGRCKRVDPRFERTILIRTKLDKFYPDLSPVNVSPWFEGFGDLPKAMPKFALSLPFWAEDGNLSTVIDELGLKPELHRYAGFENMAFSLENIIEKRFGEEVAGLLDLLQLKEEKLDEARAVLVKPRPARTAGKKSMHHSLTGGTYARALCDLMHGSLHSHVGRMTLADELLAFEKYTKLHNFDYAVVPTGRCPGFAAEVNGGAQFMRLLYEIEVYFRFLDIQHNVTERD
eukprot:g15591.t1